MYCISCGAIIRKVSYSAPAVVCFEELLFSLMDLYKHSSVITFTNVCPTIRKLFYGRHSVQISKQRRCSQTWFFNMVWYGMQCPCVGNPNMDSSFSLHFPVFCFEFWMPHFLDFHPLMRSVRPLDMGTNMHGYTFRGLMLNRYLVLIPHIRRHEHDISRAYSKRIYLSTLLQKWGRATTLKLYHILLLSICFN